MLNQPQPSQQASREEKLLYYKKKTFQTELNHKKQRCFVDAKMVQILFCCNFLKEKHVFNKNSQKIFQRHFSRLNSNHPLKNITILAKQKNKSLKTLAQHRQRFCLVLEGKSKKYSLHHFSSNSVVRRSRDRSKQSMLE